MSRTAWIVVFVAVGALNAGGCAQLELPQRGFATRYFMQSIGPRLRIDGQSDGVGESRAAIPSVDKNIAGVSTTNPDRIAGEDGAESKAAIHQKCVDVARNRGIDVGYQGFDDDAQKLVFDWTLAECLKWHSR